MYKALALVGLLLGAISLNAQGHKKAATSISPQIVARVSLKNQTAPIPTTTIFTPTQSGLYRMSSYMTLTVANGNSSSQWNLYMGWTDDAGVESAFSGFSLASYQVAPSAYAQLGFGPPGYVSFFQAVAGMPVTYSVTQSGSPDGTIYELFLVIERVQ